MKINFTLFLTLFLTLELLAQSPVISNKNFSFGSYGRAGIGYGLGTEAAFPQSLNLNGMGSIGGRFEENDYLELAMYPTNPLEVSRPLCRNCLQKPKI